MREAPVRRRHAANILVMTCPSPPVVPLQSSLIDLKEHASSLASSGLKKDSKLKSLEIAIEQKKEECSKLETQLQKVSA